MLRLALGIVVAGLAAAPTLAAPPEETAAPISPAERRFVTRVLPVLSAKCFSCHGERADAIEGELDLTTRDKALRGGESGDPSIVAWKPDESPLVEAIRWEGLEMPPKENDRLTAEQIAAVERWVREGAVWPGEERQREILSQAAAEPDNEQGVLHPTSGGLSEAWTNRRYKPEDLWAYRAVAPPELTDAERANAIDALLERRLKEAGLEPAPIATPRELIRRLTFDVLGLPPTPEEVEAFLAAWEQDADAAWASAVDRLLASPHYGEQAARHWLDVVRYADSGGFANDWERPTAWRYRDYVVRSFNDDKPFDRFVLEQLAGDELEPGDPEMAVATGFLRMGPWEHSSMSVAKITRQQYLDDVTDAVGQVLLAHPLQCARCHDHKFDPVPTRDYYAVQAVFATTQPADVDAAWLADENRNHMQRDQRFHERRRRHNLKRVQSFHKKIADEEKKWFRERGLPYTSRNEAKQKNAPPEHIPEHRIGLTPDDLGTARVTRKWKRRFEWERIRYEPVALGVYNGKTHLENTYSERTPIPEDPLAKGELQETAILVGGDPYSPSEPVAPGVLSAMGGGATTAGDDDAIADAAIPNTVGGRRLALARWITRPGHPLTARVIANRVWQSHFGRGIVGTPNNFGVMGKKPTHPALLDHLAASLVEGGWSLKKLHRDILMSAAYRRSSRPADLAKLDEADPNRELYAVFLPRRLAAEELRDAMLAVSGELNDELGGIAARPDMNQEAAMQPRLIMGTFAPAYVPNALPEQRNRRTLYALKLRGHRDPFLEVFNQPTPDISCELREQSNVTPQVFSLLNGQETLERSLALALRLLADSDDDRQAVDRLFALAYGRPASEEEAAESLAHWRRMEPIEQQAVYEPIEYPTLVTRRANEENSGRPFELREPLFEYEEYVPDVEPHAVDARTRALADLCLMILNSNEFAYVD